MMQLNFHTEVVQETLTKEGPSYRQVKCNKYNQERVLNQLVYLFSIVILFYQKNTMGCENSKQIQPLDEEHNASLRKNKKKADKIIGKVTGSMNITQNVRKVEEKLSIKDQSKIEKVIASHYFFCNFSENERSEIIEQMVTYTCQKNEYIFKQSEPGFLFFIIKKGKVAIEINGKQVKRLEKGQCFGELSLIYTAPRSASVKTLTECTFWGLHQTIFRCYTQDLVKKNYKIAKPFLQKVPLFQFLSTNEINSIAYAMNTLKYEPSANIFKEGDDANSFYIITEGQVKIVIKNKQPIVLQKGESFGENSFKKNEVRSGTALAGDHGAKLLSIGRQGLLKCLGNNIEELVEFNILKWALKRSRLFENIPNELIKSFIQLSELRECSNNQIICKERQPLKYFIVCLEGKVQQHNVGFLINQEYILEASKSDKQIFMKSNLKKHGKGNIYLLPIKKIESLLDISLIQAARKNDDIFKEYNVEKMQNSLRNDNRRPNSKISLENLVFEQKLGEGQFGKVFLVRSNLTNQKYALKCIKKKSIIELGLQNLVRNEKEILESTNHPFIVSLERTFKDEAFVYLLMQYIDGIDFFDLLREIGLCNIQVSCFYMASLILCIQQLHKNNIAYRDLKPENAVVDSKGYLTMIDLGTAKKLTEEKGNRTFTIIGTPHYMAPEILEGKGYGLEVDIWSLGVILYEMVCGKLPFGEDLDDPYLIYKEVINEKITYPSYYTNKKGKNLIEKLLEKNSRKRQIEDFATLKRDPYFQCFKWQQLYKKTMKPPVLPKGKRNQRRDKGSAEMCIVKYLAKEIKSESVSQEQSSSWDSDF